MTQGVDEAWVLGMLEKLKQRMQPFKRTYVTSSKHFGIAVQALIIGTVIFLPPTLIDRAILVGTVVVLIMALNALHRKYLPFTAIYLRKKSKGSIARIAPTIISWLLAVAAGTVATLLAVYLQGWFSPTAQ